jgi:L-lactate dehydrogenase
LSEKTASKPKVAIIGAGFVGSTFGYSLLIHGFVSQIVIVDVDRERAEGEVMDLNHGMAFAHPMKISVGDYADCADADIVVITVDLGRKIEKSRLELAEGNFRILQQIIPRVLEHNRDCIFLVATNPVDVMTYAVLKLSGFPKNRVIGSGTTLDTARLRYLLGEHLQIDPRNVHAYIIGEHGDSEVPVWSLASVAGVRLKDYCPMCRVQYSLKHFNDLFLKVRNAGYEIIQKKGHTNYAVALGLARVVESIIRDENAVLTVSCLQENYHGVSDVCVSVPAVLNRSGIKSVVELPLDQKEMEDFRKSATVVKNVADSLGL